MRVTIETTDEDFINIEKFDNERVIITLAQIGDNNEATRLVFGLNTLVAISDTLKDFIDSEITVIRELDPRPGITLSVRARFNNE
jgi:hypothetical protein